MKTKETLFINMNGIRIGELYKESSGAMSFKYDQQWLDKTDARSISLSLPLSNKTYFGDRVYNFFDNLLPDSSQIRAKIQKRFKISNNQPFDLLKSIGADCVGAIQLTSNNSIEEVTNIVCNPLSEKRIGSILRQHATAPLGITEDDNDFRISIAGVQEKTAFTWHNNNWCHPLATTPTTHIFKRPIGIIEHSQMDLSESCENEWLCLEILRSFNLPTAKATIGQFEEQKALIVKRFDRRYSNDKTKIYRLPQEDMCQALGISPNLKYESDGGPGIKAIMDFLLGSRNGESDRRVFMKTQVIFWLLAAIDGHAKNFSIFIEPSNRYSATPLYDVLSAYPLIKNKTIHKQTIKMAMALQGKSKHYRWINITPRHFLSTAKFIGFSPIIMHEILDEVRTEIDPVIIETTNKLTPEFLSSISEPIFSGIRERAKLLATL